MSVCVYCLKSPTSVCICVDCRTKLEISKKRVEDLEKQLKFVRRNNWRLSRENEQLRRRKGP